MIWHFLKRDFLDFRLWWALVAAVTFIWLVIEMVAPTVFGSVSDQFLVLAYLMFAMMPQSYILGSVWRTQHQLSRHYLLALPLPHRRLFVIQHARLLPFWLPLFIVVSVGPVFWGLGERPARPDVWILHCVGVVASTALLIEHGIWSTLETERISRYVPSGQRLLAWIRMIAVGWGVLGLIVAGWTSLIGVWPLARLHVFAPFMFLMFLPYAIFPALILMAVLWARRNARDWCVTL